MTTPEGGQYGGQYDPNWNPNQNPQQTAISQDPKNGMGIAALIFGVLALLTCWIPIIGLVLGIVAIILGIVGRGRANRLQATNKGVATGGLVLGILSAVINIILIFVVGASVLAFFGAGGGAALQQAQQCISQAQQQPNPAAVQQALEQCGQQFGSQMPGDNIEDGG